MCLVAAIRPRQHLPILPRLKSLLSYPEDPEDVICAAQLLHPDLEEFQFLQLMDLPREASWDESNDWRRNIDILLFRLQMDSPNVKILKLIPPENGYDGLIPNTFLREFSSTLHVHR